MKEEVSGSILSESKYEILIFFKHFLGFTTLNSLSRLCQCLIKFYITRFIKI